MEKKMETTGIIGSIMEEQSLGFKALGFQALGFRL